MIPGSANPLLLATADAGGYTISRSLRFNSADSAYLSRTPASAGNRKTWTWAGWVKRSKLGTQQHVFAASTVSPNDQTYIEFNTSDQITLGNANSASVLNFIATSAVYRDTSAWYHIVVAYNTTDATASNRVKLYVNGSQVTQFASATYPALNYDTHVNNTIAHAIGRAGGFSVYYTDAYLADVHLIDGQALDPTSFGEFSATTGVWMPKAYSGGSYGTNGFKLDFADNSAATAAALGKDTSGNGNNWTPTNLSVTAGAGNDSLIDVPVNGSQTDTGVGGEVRGNYCTLNPLDYGRAASTSVTLSNGNLEASLVRVTGTGVWVNSTIEIPRSGKWYAEISNATSTNILGIASLGINNLSLSSPSKFRSYYGGSGTKISEAGEISYGATYTTTDIIGIAVNMDAGTITFYKNNTSQGTAYSDLLTAGVSWCFFAGTGGGGTNVSTWNFGQRPFAYTAPSGFKALCTSSLSTPTIVKPSTVMDVVLYTGTGSTLTPTSSLGFSPDLIWIKSRSAATDHALYNTVRGAQRRLESNTTDAEVSSDNGLTAFDSAGFTLGTLAQVNTNAATYAAWCWDTGSSTVSNTAGTITSSVRASTTNGCSVLTYTSNGTNGATFGHGLGVAPQFIIIKCRESGGAGLGWAVYHQALGNTKYLLLESTAAAATDSTVWNNTSPTSTVVTLGTSSLVNSGSGFGLGYVAYCFAPVAGYSAFGSYTGNGSADGPFVYTGMRPRYLLIKNITTAYGWAIHDTARYPYNEDESLLYANATTAETTNSGFGLDVLSNGFKIRCTSAATVWNETNSVYVWAAFAESPFQYSRAR